MRTDPFELSVYHGPPAGFHADDLLADVRPRVVVAKAASPALVLGSRQALALVDPGACRDAGIDVVRRRSGGGVVLVEPEAMCWFDVVVPVDDVRFAAVARDVGASMRWLGSMIATALAELGVGGVAVHGGPLSGGQWGDLICFAGLGPGEVVQRGIKLVGISQRRARQGARFQCMVHVRWSPNALIVLLAQPRPDVDELPPVATLPADLAAVVPETVAAVLSVA